MKRNVIFILPILALVLNAVDVGGFSTASNGIPEGSGGGSSYNSDAFVPAGLKKAIHLSAGYLNRGCNDQGKFLYRINLNPDVKPKPKYNMLRHAGAIYALTMYLRPYPDKDTQDTVDRAARFLRNQAVKPVSERYDSLAVWSFRKLSGGKGPDQAKLGGTGLGLVALLSIEKIKPATTPIEDLRKMGRFILFMQKQDGSFYSKYIPSQGGRDDSWTSLYYPGEAALGLLMLYEKDPSPVWLQAAANAIAHLARIRAGRVIVEADHWALLATAKLLPLYDQCKQPLPRKAIMRHAVQICESILYSKIKFPKDSQEYGCLTSDGRTVSTATRLEGLLAALTFLPKEEMMLRERIISAVRQGMIFLLRSQIHSGRYAGGFPRAVRPLPPKHPQYTKSFNRRATEVRIDYVQHALSTMIQYEQVFGVN